MCGTARESGSRKCGTGRGPLPITENAFPDGRGRLWTMPLVRSGGEPPRAHCVTSPCLCDDQVMEPSEQARPVIAITAHVGPVSWGSWRDEQAALVPQPYVDHVTAAGGTAVVLPPLPPGATVDDARAVLGFLDGLIISGGPDVDPAHYGQQAHPSVRTAAPERDASELLLAQVTAEN